MNRGKFLKYGVIGLGGRIDGLNKWAGYDKVEDFAIVAVTDINKEMTMKRFKESPHVYPEDARFYYDADEMLDNEELDGVFIGTTADAHVEMAIKVMKRGIPLYLEKPVAITREDVEKLNEARKKYNPKCLVSFPLRYSPMSRRVREIIESGKLGKIQQVQSWNDINYGRVYHHSKHNDPKISGSLWLEKATHDLDLICYYLGEDPSKLCAMETRGLFGGDMPEGTTCDKCDKRMECPESDYAVTKIYGDTTHGMKCCYMPSNIQHDCATVIAKYNSGVIATYSQNTIVRFHGGRRGGKIYGYKGTLEYDINNAKITITMNDFDTVEVIDFHGITDPHCGGDQILTRTFADMARGKEVPSSLLEGIKSASFGLVALESCEKEAFVSLPDME